jgi:hypothetical protein
MDYKVLKIYEGKYDYDTLEVEDKDKIIYQIPIVKGFLDNSIIGKTIKLVDIYSPITKKPFAM